MFTPWTAYDALVTAHRADVRVAARGRRRRAATPARSADKPVAARAPRWGGAAQVCCA